MAFNSLVNSVMGLAFWMNSKTQEIIQVNTSSEMHIDVVVNDPEKFGIPSSMVNSVGVDDLEIGSADEELMDRAIKNGWVRIHAWGTGRELTFDVATMSRRTLDMVYDFCSNLKKNFGFIRDNTKITILPSVSGRTKEFLYSEMMDGSIFESKLNEVIDKLCGDSYWYHPKTSELLGVGETHGATLWSFPEIFGLTSKDLEDDYESGANGELEAKVVKKGWWRVHLSGDQWLTIDVYSSIPSKARIFDLVSDMLVKYKEKIKSVTVSTYSGGSKSFEFNDGILESKQLNEEIAAWWFNPKTNKFKEHPSNDHEVMVEKDPHWFGLDYEDLTGMPPKPLALQKGFVRIDVFPTFTHIEVDGKPNGKMKDALSLIAKKLYDYGMGDNYQITVAYDSRRNSAAEYNGTLEQLYSTELFESVLNEVAIYSLWFNPRTLTVKKNTEIDTDHWQMIRNDPKWFGIDINTEENSFINTVLDKGFVRVNLTNDFCTMEIKGKPNGKMKDALSWLANWLKTKYGVKDVDIYTGENSTPYSGTIEQLYSTELFENRRLR